MRALLDVNVLIAPLDDAHVHHDLARRWLGENVAAGWASCALTQLGCIRVMANPSYPNPKPAAAVARGGRFVTFDAHVPWRAVRGASRESYVALG